MEIKEPNKPYVSVEKQPLPKKTGGRRLVQSLEIRAKLGSWNSQHLNPSLHLPPQMHKHPPRASGMYCNLHLSEHLVKEIQTQGELLETRGVVGSGSRAGKAPVTSVGTREYEKLRLQTSCRGSSYITEGETTSKPRDWQREAHEGLKWNATYFTRPGAMNQTAQFLHRALVNDQEACLPLARSAYCV